MPIQLFAANDLGARLMGHALGSLPRSDMDVSACIACPIPSIWAPLNEDGERPKPDCSPVAVERLVRYYERLGFRRRLAPGDFAGAQRLFGSLILGSYHSCASSRPSVRSDPTQLKLWS
jgi:hypothetical protein